MSRSVDRCSCQSASYSSSSSSSSSSVSAALPTPSSALVSSISLAFFFPSSLAFLRSCADIAVLSSFSASLSSDARAPTSSSSSLSYAEYVVQFNFITVANCLASSCGPVLFCSGVYCAPPTLSSCCRMFVAAAPSTTLALLGQSILAIVGMSVIVISVISPRSSRLSRLE